MLTMSIKRLLLLSLIISTLGLLLATAQSNPLPAQIDPVTVTSNEGWSCGDFPCEGDIEGFMQRIQVPDGFTLSHIGQFPGQPMQLAYDNRGRLHATILEKGTRRGAVYRMNEDGTTGRVSPRFWSPVGIAFDEENRLFVSSRLNPDSVGVIWLVGSQDYADVIVNNLPCCYSIENQPNGMVFGDDGLLYVGIGSLSDRGESQTPESQRFAEIQPLEASIIQINFDSGAIEQYAGGIRNPYDLDFTSDGQLYVTDNGLVTGQGDRILQVTEDGFYGFPYWRSRGCPECPAREGADINEDWLLLNDYTRPRGMTVYDGTQFPANFVDTLFVAFWNGTEYAQRIVWINPDDVPADPETDYTPQPFVTGLIRPVDVVVAPDGSLVIADFIYGHIWRVSYGTGESTQDNLPPVIQTVSSTTEATEEILPPAIATVISNTDSEEESEQVAPPTPTTNSGGVVFATATPGS